MSPYTTEAEKVIICTMIKGGSSHNDICAALSNRHDITDWQILCIFQWYGGKENYDEVGHSTGCLHKLTPRDTRVALRHLANCDVANATELRNMYFPKVAVETVKGVLRREGRHARIRATIPFISKKNLGVWRKWAEAHLDWTPTNWRAVNFLMSPYFTFLAQMGYSGAGGNQGRDLILGIWGRSWSMEVERWWYGGWSRPVGLGGLCKLKGTSTKSYIVIYCRMMS